MVEVIEIAHCQELLRVDASFILKGKRIKQFFSVVHHLVGLLIVQTDKVGQVPVAPSSASQILIEILPVYFSPAPRTDAFEKPEILGFNVPQTELLV